MKLILFFFLILSLKVEAAKMPDFNLHQYPEGQNFRLSENLKGKKMLINFWATWCISCIHEIPLLESLKSKYGNDVIFISINAGEKSNLIARFLNKYKFSYIHLSDNDRLFSKELGVESLPITMVVDKDMNIIYRDVVPPKSL